MALTAQLVESTANRLRYLLTNATPPGTTITIPNDGGASPDLRTDLADDPSGPLRQIIRARLDGIGTNAAGTPLTQAQARDILNSDGSGASLGNNNVPRAICKIQGRTPGTSGAPANWAVDVNVDGDGDPVVVITTQDAGFGDGEAYLDIHVRHSIDL
jgi:hypothetical protein